MDAAQAYFLITIERDMTESQRREAREALRTPGTGALSRLRQRLARARRARQGHTAAVLAAHQ